MFTLVVFVLVTGGITTTAFTEAFDDVGLYGSGFDLRANTVPINPIRDLSRARRAGHRRSPRPTTAVGVVRRAWSKPAVAVEEKSARGG